MRNVRAGAVALGVALGLGVLVGPAASADSPVGDLTLSIYYVNAGTTTQVTLTCEPTGGTHPDAQNACDDLITANGDIYDIPPVSANCPAYQPVVVSANGTWAGQSDTYGAKVQSWCTANAETGGHVFDF